MKGFKLTSGDTQIILKAATLQTAVQCYSCSDCPWITQNACNDSASPSVHKLTNFTCYWQATRKFSVSLSDTKEKLSLIDNVVKNFSSSTGLQDSLVLHTKLLVG